jgi:hypothetical protein
VHTLQGTECKIMVTTVRLTQQSSGARWRAMDREWSRGGGGGGG